MWFALFPLIALADGEPPLPRATETLRIREFVDIVGDGPAWGRWRRNSGPVRAWLWDDGVIEHYERRDGKTLVEVERYDASGHPVTTTSYTDGQPSQVTVHEPGEVMVEVSSWTSLALGPVTLRVPSTGVELSEGAARWHDDSVDLDIRWLQGGGDPLSADFGEGISASCACVVEGRTAVWIDGRIGVRYRIRVPDADQPLLGEIWAVSDGSGVLTLTVFSPTLQGPAPTRTRVIAALAQWEDG